MVTRDGTALSFLLISLILLISNPAIFEDALGQIAVSGEPSGSTVLQHGASFEVGLKLKTGANVQYSMKADAFLYFDIHSHDGSEITTFSVLESNAFEGQFVAPKDGNYYFLSMNLGESVVTLTYDISFGETVHAIVHDSIRYDVVTSSNSNIDFLGFSQEDKQILILMETPYLTPGFVNITIPRSLLDGPFDLRGSITQYNHTQNESASTFIIKTNNGTNDITIVGTTVVPEFPFPIILLTLALSSFILYVRLRRQHIILQKGAFKNYSSIS
jgi:hypothetical protein